MPLQEAGVCFALIHNNNQQRNDYLLPHLENLIDAISLKFNVKRVYISAQPKLVAHRTWTTVLRCFLHEKLSRSWGRYRKIKPRILLRAGVIFFNSNIRKYCSKRTLREIGNRNSFIETILTDKHIRAWNAFIESDCEYLICFEDDAVFQDNSAERLSALFDTLIKRGASQFTYVDLAGGCDIKDLQISQLVTIKQGGFTHYSKPVTNTTCVYVLSRLLVSEFLNQLTRRPWLRLIAIDWMINQLFIDIEKNNSEILCMHSEPSIFHHGSTIGAYRAWRK